MRDRSQTGLIIIAGLLVLALAVAVSSLLRASLMGGGMGGPGMMGGYGPGSDANAGSWGRMLLFWVLLLGGLALVGGWLFQEGYLGGSHATGTGVRRGGNDTSRSSGAGGPSALDILQQRYARGELTTEQYGQMRRDIQAD